MATETKPITHTRGPWKAMWNHPDLAVWGRDAEGNDFEEHVASIYGDGSEENADANARLIAAAPDLFTCGAKLCAEVIALLAIAEEAVREAVGNSNVAALELRLEEMTAAIAKAEGSR